MKGSILSLKRSVLGRDISKEWKWGEAQPHLRDVHILASLFTALCTIYLLTPSDLLPRSSVTKWLNEQIFFFFFPLQCFPELQVLNTCKTWHEGMNPATSPVLHFGRWRCQATTTLQYTALSLRDQPTSPCNSSPARLKRQGRQWCHLKAFVLQALWVAKIFSGSNGRTLWSWPERFRVIRILLCRTEKAVPLREDCDGKYNADY